MANLEWMLTRSTRLNEGYGMNITKYKLVTNFNDYNIEKYVAIKNQGEILLLKGEWHDFKISLCLRWDIHLIQPLDISTSGSQAVTLGPALPPSIPLVLGPLDVGWIISMVSLVFQLSDSRLWDFSASNSYNKSPLTYICIYPIGSASPENPIQILVEKY